VLLTGEQTQEEKQFAVDAVQFGDHRILLANTIVGGTGWTLDNVDTIIFADKSYNPIDNEQAADRFIPTDPNKEYGAKQIITLIGKGSIEQRIDRLLDQKINIIEFINNYGINALVDNKEGENNNSAGIHNKR
jgi:SNF2 family DNA or RNA helicase